MFGKIIVFFSVLFVLSGCGYNAEPIPEIISRHQQAPKIFAPPPKPIARKAAVPAQWIPPKRLEKKWTAVVIHHSATKYGSVVRFDKWAREGKHWEGVGYDFVIGNGYGSGDGELEVTFRWHQQKTGAHCATRNNWANKEAVGICLVGNFNLSSPTAKQMRSLIKLTNFLSDRYGISKERIYGHGTTPGAHATDCPGGKFPMAWFKSKLDF